ncbi:hypothetical protein MMC25_002168 [Agyrium rufum]|nr:hypothetical protein [Agyrium rufum]
MSSTRIDPSISRRAGPIANSDSQFTFIAPGARAQDAMVSGSNIVVRQPVIARISSGSSDFREFLSKPSSATRPWTGGRTRSTGSETRIRRNREVDPDQTYMAITAAPASWDCFRYTKDGELDPERTYSKADIKRYLFKRPQDAGKLTLYIQNVPADSQRRYPHPKSNRCRLACCPAEENTIRVGLVRVAFDETHPSLHTRMPKERWFDPMLHAGYMHLYCMEQYFDFPQICQKLDVRVDRRRLPYEPAERNRMAFCDKEEPIVVRFLETCRTGETPSDYPQRTADGILAHEGTLTHRLCDKKVTESMNYKQWIRQRNRLGLDLDAKSTLDRNLGDLKVRAPELKRTNSRGKDSKELPCRRLPTSGSSSRMCDSPLKRTRFDRNDSEDEDDRSLFIPDRRR